MRSKFALLRRQIFGIIVLTGLCFVRPVFAVAEILTPDENRQAFALVDLKWKDKLSADDVAAVMRGLQSDKGAIFEDAVDVIALHRLKEALPILQARKRMSPQYRLVSKVVIESLRVGADPIEPMRDLLLENAMAPEWLVEYSHGGRAKDKLVMLVGIDEARSLRRGKEPNAKVKRIKLTGQAKPLVYYGSMKPEAAINDIFQRLHNVTTLASGEEYDLSSALESYGEKSFDLLLKKFAAVRDLNTMTGYGIDLLLLPIRRYAMWHDLSAEQAARANELIDRLEAQGSPYVAQDIFWLRKSIELNAKKNKAAETPQAATAAP